MQNFDLVKILGIGLSGFGFLLMFLAYRLIVKLIGNTNTQKPIISMVRMFMIVSFTMTLAVGAFTIVNSFYKKDEVASLADNVKEQATTIKVLETSNENEKVTNDIVKSIATGGDITAYKKQQKRVLDSLNTFIDKQPDAEVKTKAIRYTALVNKLSDSLQMKNQLPPAKYEAVKVNYLRLNDSIYKLSKQVAAKSKIATAERMVKLN